MSGEAAPRRSLRQRAVAEVVEFVGIFLYLYVCLGLFVLNKHLILASAHVDFAPYGFALVKALILAKFIMLIQHFHDGRRFINQPLALSTLFMAVTFSIILIAMSMVEEVVMGLFHGETALAALERLTVGRMTEIASSSIVMLVALIPYFAFRQIGHVVGEERLVHLFFVGGAKAEALRRLGRMPD